MKPSVWTAAVIEEWLVEAADTEHLLPDVPGPREFGNAMPTPVRDWQNYGQEPSRYIRRAGPGAIDRMMHVVEWLNALPDSQRALLRGWSKAKARKGRSVQDFAAREGIKSRTLRWTVTRLCQRIADDLNQQAASSCVDATVDAVAEILAYEPADSVPDERPRRSPTSWLPGDAKPKSDLSPEAAERIARLIERMNKRLRKRRRGRRKSG